jgi:uncharacterized protein
MDPALQPELLVLLIIDAAGEHLHGKTLLQKRAFFLCQHFTCSTEYYAHYYGPYSPAVDSTIGRLKSLGVIEEKNEGFGRSDPIGFEWRKYELALTADGRTVINAFEEREPDTVREIRNFLGEMQKAGDNGDYVSLSIAAKTYFILKSEHKSITRDEIEGVATHLGWKVGPKEIARATDFLETLHLGPAYVAG